MVLCDVPLWTLPASTKFGHPYGITINERTSIGTHCTIMQNVTIGHRHKELKGAFIGENVYIGAGAMILGPAIIGDNAIIAAGAVVLEDVPENCTYITRHESTITHQEAQR